MSRVMKPQAPAKAHGWSDEEKLALLFMLIPEKVKWTDFTPPPGRTKKACIHIVNNMRHAVKNELPLDSSIAKVGKVVHAKRKASTATKHADEGFDEELGEAKGNDFGEEKDSASAEDVRPKKRARTAKKLIAKPVVKKEVDESEEELDKMIVGASADDAEFAADTEVFP